MAKLKGCTAILVLLTMLSCTVGRSTGDSIQVRLNLPVPDPSADSLVYHTEEPQYLRKNGQLYRLYTITALVRIPGDSLQLKSRRYAKSTLWQKD